MREEDLKTEKSNECFCELNDLEEDDTLYMQSSWDGGIGFDYIHPIKYCPICGRKLPRRVSMQ